MNVLLLVKLTFVTFVDQNLFDFIDNSIFFITYKCTYVQQAFVCNYAVRCMIE